MNNFKGVLEDYNWIAVDYFDEDALQCTAFFLSHCHTDHMYGLGKDPLFNRLRMGKCCGTSSVPAFKLHCSNVTYELLVGDEDFRWLQPYMEKLNVGDAFDLSNPNNAEDVVTVTLLPAGHCPGSVMFLFEGARGTVLYTGDFRLTSRDLEKMESLYQQSNGTLKVIDKLYLDTTFFSCSGTGTLPTRTESRDILFGLLSSKCVDGDKGNHVHFRYPAQFGYEHLFVELHKKFRMRVHVTEHLMWKYQAVADIADAVTLDGKSTRFHACGLHHRNRREDHENLKVPFCKHLEEQMRNDKVLFVKFSAMHFAMANISKEDEEPWIRKLYASPSKGKRRLSNASQQCTYHICYSLHSSHEEIMEVVNFLRPKVVHPLVVPKKGITLDSMVKKLTMGYLRLNLPVAADSLVSPRVEPAELFGSLKNQSQVMDSGDTCSYSPPLLLDSPVAAKKKRTASASSSPVTPVQLFPSDTDGGTTTETESPEWTLLPPPLKATSLLSKDSVKINLEKVLEEVGADEDEVGHFAKSRNLNCAEKDGYDVPVVLIKTEPSFTPEEDSCKLSGGDAMGQDPIDEVDVKDEVNVGSQDTDPLSEGDYPSDEDDWNSTPDWDEIEKEKLKTSQQVNQSPIKRVSNGI